MYINKKNHIISEALFVSSGITVVTLALNALLRLLITRNGSVTPDMLEYTVYRVQQILAGIEIVLIIGVFIVLKRRLDKIQHFFDTDEQREIAELQKEYNVNGVSTIDVESMSQLMSIWAAILIGVRMVYELMSGLYTEFVENLFSINITFDPGMSGSIVKIYNNTHGFKYLGMFIAINIGIFVTGVFLRDRFLKGFAIVMAVVFLITSYASNMTSVDIMGRTVGIVWTSVLFHILQTFGLMFISFYLIKKHRGM